MFYTKVALSGGACSHCYSLYLYAGFYGLAFVQPLLSPLLLIIARTMLGCCCHWFTLSFRSTKVLHQTTGLTPN